MTPFVRPYLAFQCRQLTFNSYRGDGPYLLSLIQGRWKNVYANIISHKNVYRHLKAGRAIHLTPNWQIISYDIENPVSRSWPPVDQRL